MLFCKAVSPEYFTPCCRSHSARRGSSTSVSIAQPSFTVHFARASPLLPFNIRINWHSFFQSADESLHGNVTGGAKIQGLQKIDASLADFWFRNERLRLAEFLGQFGLTEASFFPNFSQQRAKPAVTQWIIHSLRAWQPK